MNRRVLSSFVLAGALFAGGKSAFSDEFGKIPGKFYGHANAYIGYSFQKYKGFIEEQIDFHEYMEHDVSTRDRGHAIDLGLGYNVYYELNDIVHPFLGIDLRGRIPLYGFKAIDGTFSNTTLRVKYLELLMLHGKFGAKFNLHKNVQLQPYALIGLSANYFNYDDTFQLFGGTESDKSDGNIWIGLSTGAGIEIIINDMFIVGAEYRYGAFTAAINDGWGNKTYHAISNHTISAKFGIQFL